MMWPRKEVPRIDTPPIYSPSNIVAYLPQICRALQSIELLAMKSTAGWLTNTNRGCKGTHLDSMEASSAVTPWLQCSYKDKVVPYIPCRHNGGIEV